MTSKETRQLFLDFFRSKGHEIVPSAPMVVKNDPTLMFTNAGMNQFKDYFLGNSVPKNPRIADTQKCLRVSGKHNDLEEVGVDTYHHTMFEMLGNWSFGDPARPNSDASEAGGYFKKEAIDWAWELLTEIYKIDKDRLYVTVFGGDEKDNLPKDAEAIGFWKNWIAEDRILECSKKDNFWEMGDTGPCGPCSEIHVDIRDDSERKKLDGKTLVNTGNPLVIEIWNLVFIQFERKADGSLRQLPAKHIDTGMGFERLCMVLQHKKSNYDTDVFQPLIREIENVTGIKYGHNIKKDISMRVIADHIRAISFSIADGQLPSNTGAGYVIRRILRRAVRYGYSFLKQEEPFIYKLVSVLAEQMGDFFPELKSQKELIEKVIREEEESFLRTLNNGLVRLDAVMQPVPLSDILPDGTYHLLSQEIIPGNLAFELYDTYGFPIDLTQLLAKEKGWKVDMNGFYECLEKQKNRSRKVATVATEDWKFNSSYETIEGAISFLNMENQDKHFNLTEFIGYDELDAKIRIAKYRKVKSKGKEQYQLVFDKTPFYAESGGQVGDTGVLISPENEKIYITDTKKENNLIVHFADKLPSNPEGEFKAFVNREKRLSTMNNHSATHLLHEALRKILGTHVQQKGSLVHPDYLRFDFSHFQKMTEEEIEKVENFVNEKIRENISIDPIHKQQVPIEEAKAMGAMALFGEKYGDRVRVIRFGDSVELCGGTHVPFTGQIGFFKILSESAVAAGIRRIEAITGEKAQQFINEQLKKLEQARALLKNPKDIEKAIRDLLDANSSLGKQIEAFNLEKAATLKEELLKNMEEINGINFIAEKISLDSSAIKNLCFQLKSQVENLFLVLGSESGGKANLTVAISDKLQKEKNFNASVIVRELAREIEGGGGGQPNYATAGGSKMAGIPGALKKAKSFIS